MHDRLTRRGGGVLIAVDSELTSDAGSKAKKDSVSECKVHELSEKSAKRIRCFHRANFAFINSVIACSDWCNLYLCTNITEAVNIFYNVLNAVFYTCVPTYYAKISNQPPWLNKELARFFQTTYSTSSPPDQSCPYDIPKSNFIFRPVISES